jgi:transcriptional regulator with XRE-family HTH domain
MGHMRAHEWNYKGTYVPCQGVLSLPFAECLKLCRNIKNISQRQLAEDLGISVRAYKYYESGEREPTVSTLIALADYFDVSLDYLVGRSDKPERQ